MELLGIADNFTHVLDERILEAYESAVIAQHERSTSEDNYIKTSIPRREFGNTTRAKWTDRRPGESQIAYDTRIDTRRYRNRERMRSKREETVKTHALNAYLAIQKSKDEAHSAAKSGTVCTPSVLSADVALASELDKSRLSARGTRVHSDVMRLITEHFEGTSKRLGKVRLPSYADADTWRISQFLRSYEVFKSMRESSPWLVSKAIPVPFTPTARLPHTEGFGRYAHVTSGTQSERLNTSRAETLAKQVGVTQAIEYQPSVRQQIHWQTVTDRLSHQGSEVATQSIPCDTPTVQTVTLYAQYALAYADGPCCEYPRSESSRS